MSKNLKLQINYVPIKTIVPYINNTRKHSNEQIEQIKASINEFGMCTAIGIHDNTIVYGHGRYEALKQLGYEEIPVVDLSHLSQTQRKALVIADNKIGDNSSFDDELLKLEIESLIDFEFDINVLGFSDEELAALEIGLIEISDEQKQKQDEVPELEENPVIKYGDLIEMGEKYQHRFLCGDSTNKNDVLKLMDGVLADQLVTDPPYNVSYEGSNGLTIKNDSMDDSSFRKFLFEAYRNANEVLKDGATFYIWHADSEGYNFRGAAFDVNWKVRQCLIWRKNSLVMGRQDYHWQHEPCLYGWKDGASHLWASDRKQTTVLDFDKPKINDVHPTMKPVELIEYCIKNNTKGQDIVLDLFLGSGTAIIACENLGRNARGMEFDPKYAQVIVQRYVDYTSNPMIKINGVEVDWYEYKDLKENNE